MNSKGAQQEPREFTPTVASALRSEHEFIPVLHPDFQGYVLEQDVIDGFADDTDLTENQRIAVAKLAEMFAPEGASGEQRALLASSEPQPASELGLTLAADEDRLIENFLAGDLQTSA